VEGRAWIAQLPAALARQAGLLERLLDAVEADERFRAFELQCSVARGAGDELSDLDAGLWVADEVSQVAVAAVPRLIRSVGEIVDVLEQPAAARPYFFAQYADGTQLDLVVQPASRARGRVPNAIVLLDRNGLLSEPREPRSLHAGDEDLREWSFLAWLALSNLAKYLERGSLWEAWSQLEEARGHLLKLHAAHEGVAYPGFGLTSILDEPAAQLPSGLETTIATLDATTLREAARALAGLLDRYGSPPLAAAVRTRL
jgi:hypothetical protein